MSVQSEHDELKAAKTKIDELHRIDETHTKQMKFLEHTRLELERQIATTHDDSNALRNGNLVNK